MKNLLTVGGLLCLAALQGCSAGSPANVYAATPDKVFAVLDQMDIPSSPQGPMGTLEITKTTVEPKSISWTGSGAHAIVKCTATLVPLDPARTQVDVACGGGGPSEGAAAGAVSDLTRFAMIEQVDSTLRGRPFDWHGVSIKAGANYMTHLPKMESDALKMNRETQESLARGQAEMQARMQAEVAASGQIPHDPNAGQPTQPAPLDPRGVDPVPIIN